MFRVKLSTGDILDFKGECNEVRYSDDKVCIFLKTDKNKYKTLAIIPYDNILYIENYKRED